MSAPQILFAEAPSPKEVQTRNELSDELARIVHRAFGETLVNLEPLTFRPDVEVAIGLRTAKPVPLDPGALLDALASGRQQVQEPVCKYVYDFMNRDGRGPVHTVAATRVELGSAALDTEAPPPGPPPVDQKKALIYGGITSAVIAALILLTLWVVAPELS
jgi:hypothetical protein